MGHLIDFFGQFAPHTVGHFQGNGGHDIVLGKAEQGAQHINDRHKDTDLGNGAQVDAGHQPIGHQGRHIADFVGADNGHHGA